MSIKQKKPPPYWMAALVPLTSDGSDRVLRARWRKAILIGDDATKDEQNNFYQMLIKIKWFPPKAKTAILQVGGSYLRKQKSDDEARRLMRLQNRIKRGATYKQVAAGEGITVTALRQQLKRFRRSERSAREEGARRKRALST
jgi:hypothetical protein